MISVLILAFALSMDAFAVSISLGAKFSEDTSKLALKAGIYFGVSQAIMPLIGYFIGKSVSSWIEQYTHWVAFILLLIIGSKMIYEALSHSKDEQNQSAQHKTMFFLALATSLDAMAAGFSLTLFDLNPYISCLLIGFITLAMSYIGVFVGSKGMAWLEDKAELIGGVILILIGIKLLF
jgi:putative Mn2+ efflux pump MntP